MRNSKPILLIEDDCVDIMTVKRTFKDLKITNQLVCSGDGNQALEYLRSEDNEKPCLILLDLNVPKMNGIEFLRTLKADEELKKIPVIVLTTSKKEQDVIESFKLCIAGYIVKLLDYKKFVEAIRIIDLYWTLSELPNEK